MAVNVGSAPTIQDVKQENPRITMWFKEATDRLKVYSGTSNPTAAQVPQGEWIIFNNTSLSEVRIWTNVSGTLKKSAAFT